MGAHRGVPRGEETWRGVHPSAGSASHDGGARWSLHHISKENISMSNILVPENEFMLAAYAWIEDGIDGRLDYLKDLCL